MRTVKGFEAIEIAATMNIPLYDVDYRIEVSVTQARQFIESKRDPKSFVLRNWPDTDAEAEQIVLNTFYRVLKETRRGSMRIVDMEADPEIGMPIHVKAAELVAERLVHQNQLEIVEEHEDYKVYGLPKTTYLRRSFLDDLSNVVCEECAHLDLGAPFHEACLVALVDYVSNGHFTISDITEVRQLRHASTKWSKPAHSVPEKGMKWLAKTASITKSKWQTVLKPMLTGEGQSEDEVDDATVVHAPPRRQQPVVQAAESETAAAAALVSDAPRPDLAGRAQITKAELIEYLRSVEVLDDTGELRKMKTERDDLLEQASSKQQTIDQLEKQRAFLEKQCAEMQRDLDTLIGAMQIAKRRAQPVGPVVDATYESE